MLPGDARSVFPRTRIDSAPVATTVADIDSVKQQGGDIARFNLASEPLEFAGSEHVRSFLQVVGSSGLPLVLVDGVTVMTGHYPTRDQLVAWASVTASASGTTLPLAQAAGGGCCGGAAAGAEEPASSTAGCCGGAAAGAEEPASSTAGCCS